MSPETAKLRKRKEEFSYNPFISDMWSLGVTFYQLITFDLPFEADDIRTYLKKVRDPDEKIRPLPEGTNERWVFLIDRLLDRNPDT